MISSFNEYHETTHIEPSHKYGEFFLEQTRAFTQELEKKHRARERA